MLKEILNNEEVKESIVGFLIGSLKIDREASGKILETVQSQEKENSTRTEILGKDNFEAAKYPIKYENNLHYSKEKDMYLLESRLFDKNDSMINAHLLLIHAENLKLKSQYVDDVWTYAKDWQLAL